jgi:hypothetical protein
MAEQGTIFRARLEQIGEGMYRAFYQRDAGIAEPAIDTRARGHVAPDMHTGTDPDSVSPFVESLAKNQGYFDCNERAKEGVLF